MKRTTKAAAVFLALIMAVFSFTGCAKDASKEIILYNTESLYIERQGAKTSIYDLEGNATYTINRHRAREKKNASAWISKARTIADTDTIHIQTVHGLIIVTSKANGAALYIR